VIVITAEHAHAPGLKGGHEAEHGLVKPIRDALSGLIYIDDKQISCSETNHISIDAAVKIRRASKILLAAYNKGHEFLYVSIEDAPDFIQLPM
jgi:crossover junction endodeoxyribonuclease RusA